MFILLSGWNAMKLQKSHLLSPQRKYSKLSAISLSTQITCWAVSWMCVLLRLICSKFDLMLNVIRRLWMANLKRTLLPWDDRLSTPLVRVFRGYLHTLLSTWFDSRGEQTSTRRPKSWYIYLFSLLFSTDVLYLAQSEVPNRARRHWHRHRRAQREAPSCQ